MKRILKRILLLTALFLLLFSVSAFANNNTRNASDETINVIKLLEIANGDNNGNMNFDKEVTRAEFIKMAISASTSKETAANIKLNISLFPDVKNSYWGAGYISVAINNGLVNGYLDGTFKPNNKVTLEEAATIVLRLLGYSDSDFVGSYPAAQLKKYEDLKLNENIFAEKGDKLTREECMILLYNALSAKMKNGNVYCTVLGLSVNNEGKLDYPALLEEKLDGPVIVNDSSDLFGETDFKDDENTTYILNNVRANKSDLKENDVIYYSNIINTVFAYRKTATGIVNSSNSTSVTISGKTYPLSTTIAKDKLSLGGEFNESKSFVTLVLGINDGVIDVIGGDISKISENDNNSTHLSMIAETISKPIYIKDSSLAESWQSLIPFSLDGSLKYHNSKETETLNVSVGDVLYYSGAFKSIWLFRKTVSGNIEQISPVTSPTTVTVSGKTYNIASSEAAYSLSIYGSYDVGDRVTVTLGLNDECVAVNSAETSSGMLFGVVTAVGEKSYKDKDGEDYTADYVTVVDTSNASYTYEHDNKYLSVGDAVKVIVSDKVVISKLTTEVGKGTAALLSNAIRNGLFSEDCEIIDFDGTQTIKVKPERISGAEIDVEQFTFTTIVLYHEFDESGNISKLILKNFTGDTCDYGIVTSISQNNIKYMTDKNEKNLQLQDINCSTGPVRLYKTSGQITAASTLTGKLENISAISHTCVFDDKDNEYLLSDNVKIFIKNAGTYTYSSVSDVSNGKYKLTAYYDKLPKYGGRIRVIIAIRNV